MLMVLVMLFSSLSSPGMLQAAVEEAEENEGLLQQLFTVTSATYMNLSSTATELKFDFGTSASPVESGYTKVTETTLYDPGAGYGFDAAATVGRNRSGPDALRRDFVFGPNREFKVDVTNGEYEVKIIAGDTDGSNRTYFTLEGGGVKGGLNSSKGNFNEYTEIVTVTDGQLNIFFPIPPITSSTNEARINVIEIKGNSQTPSLDVSVLQQLIATAKAIPNADRTYTNASYQALQTAIAAAEASVAAIDSEAALTAEVNKLQSAIDGLTIRPPVDLKFDFGRSTSPVASGYTQITEATEYHPGVGYGFDAPASGSSDRDGADDLRRDFVSALGRQFMVDVPNGEYDVTIIAGDQIASNRTHYSFEGGSVIVNPNTSAGAYRVNKHTVTVSDGQLNISFPAVSSNNARINVLEVKVKPLVPAVDISALQQLIATAKAISNADRTYTNASYQALQTAIAAAEASVAAIDSEAALAAEVNKLQSAIDGLTIRPPVDLKFDFGRSTSPVASGYTQITEATEYSLGVGYGFDAPAASSSDRDGTDDLRRDFVSALNRQFMVDVPNGEYDVTIITGDQIASNRTHYSFEGGTVIVNPNTSAGSYNVNKHTVTVSDGQLNISFPSVSSNNARINVIEIKAKPQAPAVDVTGLQQLITTAKAIHNQNWTYTLASYQALQTAIAAAEASLATIDSELSLQAELTKLQAAIDELAAMLLVHLKFDFGRESSELAEGYARVHEATIYSSQQQYGFVTAAMGSRDQGGPDALRRDFVIAQGSEFIVDLPEGKYQVLITTGSQDNSDRASYSLEGGAVKGGDYTAAGEFKEYKDIVKVTDGQLNITFSNSVARINALEIKLNPVDTSDLEQLIASSKVISNENWTYTKASYLLLQSAIAAAEASLTDIDTNEALQMETEKLQAALDGLVLRLVSDTPEYLFDFGTESSELAEGYRRVAHTTLYSVERTYGFDAVTEGSRDQGAPDDLHRDFIISRGREFKVDLPNGDYEIRIIAGSFTERDRASYSLERGAVRGGYYTNIGEFKEYIDTVKVQDGQLNIAFSNSVARINAVEVRWRPPMPILEQDDEPVIDVDKWLKTEGRLKFDFGSSTSPVEKGYIPVANTTYYSKASGYGLDKKVDYRDRKAPDSLRRDFILGSSYEFMLDLPNGDYFIRLIAGDQEAFNRTGFTIEGIDKGSITSQIGAFAELTSMVTLEDGQLNIQMRDNGRLNALEVIPMSQVTSLTAAVKTMSPSPSVQLAWEANEAAVGYKVYRKTEGEEVFEQIGSSATPGYTDQTVELGYTYYYAVALLTVDDIESKLSHEAPVVVVNKSARLPQAPQGLQIAEALSSSMTIKWTESKGALKYYVYRSRFENGVFVRIGVTDKTIYTDSPISTYSPYYYKVSAVNDAGRSPQSETLQSPIVERFVRSMEVLDRAPVAIQTEKGVYIGWRMLGTDPESVSFDLYRDGQKINAAPIVSSTNYLDAEGTADSTYQIRVTNGSGSPVTETVGVWNKQYHSIKLDKPAGGVNSQGEAYSYTANDASVGDLDGDGSYEIVLKWEPTNSQDNSRAGHTGKVYLDAYRLDGTKLWRIDAGRNIRAGAHYTQFLVYDLDGDGRAEVVFKTADGTVDGEGHVIGDAAAHWVNEAGYVLDGPEYLTVFEGLTGKALHTIDYYPPRGNVSDWGDNYGNRVDRFLAGVAYLDGVRPSIIMTRGYYTRAVVAAYDYSEGQLVSRWVFDTNESGNEAYAGQGNHNLSVADVDGDGLDEIVYGASIIDDDGTGLYATGWGHGDALHVSDFNPNRPGMEIYQPHESALSPYGFGIRDAESGKSLWGIRTETDVGRGLAADIDPRYVGAELWSSGSWDGSADRSALFSADGKQISQVSPKSINHAIWWDGDLLRELLDHDFDQQKDPFGRGKIEKWNWEEEKLERIYAPAGIRTNNGTKGNPSLQADLLGDWREEVVWASSDSQELQIHTTTDLTEHRIFTLMHDPVYRLGVAWQNVGYNQPPHTSYYLGAGMAAPTGTSARIMTRAEFAASIVNALGLPAATDVGFQDVDSSNPLANDIASAYAAGIISGYSEDTFAPDAVISRQETAVMLWRAYEYAGGTLLEDLPGSDPFADDEEISLWAKDAVYRLRELGLLQRSGEDRFEPHAAMNRMECYQAISKLLN
jgi:fibronectin type 3 domain-containing protein